MTTADRPTATPLRGTRALDEEDVGLLIDSPALQKLMDGFQKFSGLAMAIIDLKGKVLVAAGWQEICTRFHRIHPETCRHCVESDIHLSANLDEGRYSLYKCKNGLWDMATPVVLDGKHIANVFNGQFFLGDEPLDVGVFERQAEKYGFDRAAYLAALAKVPRVSRQRAQEVMEFYVALASMVVRLSRGTIALRTAMRAQARAEEEQRLRDLFDKASVGIFRTSPEGRLLYANPALAALFGYPGPAEMGEAVRDFAEQYARPGQREAVLRLAAGSGEPISLETDFRRKDGEVFTGDLRVRAVCDDRGQVVSLEGFLDDITERKRAERELRAASLHARSLIEASLDPLVTISPAGKISDVNRATEQATGLSRAELIGTDFADYFTEPERAQVGYQRVLAEGYVRDYPLTLRHRSGLSVEVLYNASVYRNESGDLQGVFAAARDVTERKRTEEALRHSEHSLNEAQRIAHLGNWELDLVSKALSWSAEIYRILEIDPAEFGASYDAFLAAIHPDDRKLVDKAYGDSVANRTPYDIVHRLLMKDGRIKYVHEQCETTYGPDGRPLRSIGTAQDVTGRRRAEEALQRERDRVNTIMAASPVAMVRVAREGRVTFANDAAEKLLGLKRDAIEQRSYNAPEWEITDWDGAPFPEGELPFAKVMRTGQPVTVNHAITRPDGERVLLSVMGAPLFDAAGQIDGGVFGIEDATGRRRMENQLRQSQKLEAVGRLAGGIAHDFNNLLTAILSGCEQLLDKLREPDPLYEEAADIRQAATRAASLTRQLLTFSRKQVVQPRVLEIDEIVAGMDRMLRRLIGEDVQLTTVAHAAARVKVDPGQIEQVIVNLAVNARDAMPGGGRITIETAAVDLGPEEADRHLDLPPGSYVMLAISDTGAGMSPEVQSHLFEPFFTTKEAGKGTGLGLSTVYGIVKQAGGHVFVYSERGKGTVFKVYLPRVAESAEASPIPRSGPPLRGTETVLVVEDDPLVRRLAVKVLRGAGYHVLEAVDGEDALRVSAAAGDRAIEVLVTDTVMPRLGGEELADRMRQARPGIRVLFMSGYTEHGVALQRQVDEGSAFLQKPFSANALAQRVRELLDRAGAAAAAPR